MHTRRIIRIRTVVASRHAAATESDNNMLLQQLASDVL